MAIKLRTEDYRSVAGTALTGTLANVGDVTANRARIVQIFNGCDDAVIVSWDGGATEGFNLPATSGTSIDCAINDTEAAQKPMLPKLSQFQAKHAGSTPTSGNLSITVVY